MRGGHSGIVIHEGRANANIVMAQFLQPMIETYNLQLAQFDGGTTVIVSDYPAWDYAPISHLRDLMLNSYDSVLGWKPELTVVHGGLECSVFYGKIPGLDIVTTDPTITEPHSVDERLEVQSSR